jgi:hypothetical protein
MPAHCGLPYNKKIISKNGCCDVSQPSQWFCHPWVFESIYSKVLNKRLSLIIVQSGKKIPKINKPTEEVINKQYSTIIKLTD